MPDDYRAIDHIDELSRVDPLWQRVLEQEERTPRIMLWSFINRITDAQVFVADILELHEANSESILKEKMRGIPELVSNPEFYIDVEGKPTNPNDSVVKLLVEKMEGSFKNKIEKDYPRWVLNQALVTYCTIFDAFLDSCVEAVFLQNPKILYGVAAGKNIELKKVVELGSVDAVVTAIRAKEIKTFSHGEITERINYFGSKLSVEIGQLFDWKFSDEDKDRRLEGWDIKMLESIYNKRHEIVHRDKHPVSTYEELDIIAHFFKSIAAKLAILLRRKHGLTWDILLIASRYQRYSSLKAQSGSVS
jgi:hypothetical protein